MDPLQRRTVGKTRVQVTQVGLGTAPLGGWPTAVSAEQASLTIARAWDVGLRYFDTAPLYGHGLSETNLGSVLAARDRDSFTLSTKVGRILVAGPPGDTLFDGVPPVRPIFDFSAEGVQRSLRESRKRLGINRFDIAFIHDPDDHHEEAVEIAYPVLAELRAAGQVGAIGVGMNWSEPLARFACEADFDCFLLAGRYTLLEQNSMEELLPCVVEKGMSIIAGGVFNSGLLIDPAPGSTYNYATAPDHVLARAQAIKEVCDSFEVPIRAAALQFPLAHHAVASVVVGARTPVEVEDTMAMATVEIPSELWFVLKDRGLMRRDAPTPADQ